MICHMFVETVGDCIPFALTHLRVKEMMPMAQIVITQLIPTITKTASFATYLVALFTTGDAIFATALRNLQIED